MMRNRSYKGRYKPSNPKKYIGDHTNIIYRSLWERKVMVYLDTNPNILEWKSEEFSIVYDNPITGGMSRYFPDFWIKYRNNKNIITQKVIEVKPKKYTKPPPKNPKRKTRVWKNDVLEYVKNRAKWTAAEKYCKKKGIEFQILTEDFLSPYK